MVTADTPSPAKMCKRWGLLCPFCAQTAQHPSLGDSYWLEEDWDGNIDREKRKEKQGKGEEMKQRQEVEVQEKQIFDPNYYPPSPVYVPSYEEEPHALVRNWVPVQVLEKTTNTKQNEKEDKTEEDRRIMLELLDE